MKLITDPKENIGHSICATIGIFDGVHLGHKSIIDRVKQEAESKNLDSCIITFRPHPQEIITGTKLPLIVPFEERMRLFEQEGIDITVCYNFTKAFSQLTAEAFITDQLVTTLNLKEIYIGPDFVFGKNRGGNPEFLSKLGIELGFKTTIVKQVTNGNSIVSSTEIRRLIKEGDVSTANLYLGRRFCLEGVISEGEKRGRLLGFPTANLNTDWELLPKLGVYVTYALIDTRVFKSITNVGYRPTFGKNTLLVETHIFDYSGDVYGNKLRVEFLKRLRDEKKFSGIEELKKAISDDVENASIYFNSIKNSKDQL